VVSEPSDSDAAERGQTISSSEEENVDERDREESMSNDDVEEIVDDEDIGITEKLRKVETD